MRRRISEIRDGRHPDLLDGEQVAARMGVPRLDKLPAEYRPRPIAYHAQLYHIGDVDAMIEKARVSQQAQEPLPRRGGARSR